MLYNSSENKQHRHIVYLPESGEGGIVLEADGHTHGLLVTPEGVKLDINGKKAHDHLIESQLNNKELDEVEEAKDTLINEIDKISTFKELLDEVKQNEQVSRDKAQSSYDFYQGKQWDEEDKQTLKNEGRSYVTVNLTSPAVDTLMGFHFQNRKDIRYFPVEEGDRRVAEVLTEVTKNIQTNNNFQQVESGVFRDEVIAGRGVFNTYVDYDADLRGKIVIEHLPYDRIYIGPHNKIDASDCEYFIKYSWFSKAKLKVDYPDKAKEMDLLFNTIQEETSEGVTRLPKDAYKYGAKSTTTNTKDDIDLAKQNIKVYELWRKIYKSVLVVTRFTDGYTETFETLSKELQKQLEDNGFDIVKRTVATIQVYKIAGDILLTEYTSELPMFPFIVCYAKKVNETWYGKIDEVKEQQMELNKRTSQALDMLNKCVSRGWIYDRTTFDDTKEENNFKNNCSRAGFTAKVANINNQPKQTDGMAMNQEVVAMSQLAGERINQILGVPKEILGNVQREISSVALMELKQGAITSNNFLYENLDIAKKQLGRLLLYYIQQVYTSDRIVRLIRNSRSDIAQTNPELAQMEDAAIQELLTTNDLSQYDVAVDLSLASPTVRNANMQLILEATRMGMPIPPQVLFEMSDFPGKEKILNIINQQQQQQAQAEQQKNQTEIEKTTIAAQAKQNKGV